MVNLRLEQGIQAALLVDFLGDFASSKPARGKRKCNQHGSKTRLRKVRAYARYARMRGDYKCQIDPINVHYVIRYLKMRVV